MPLSSEPVRTPLSERFRSQTRRFYADGSVAFSPSNCVMPTRYRKFAQRILDFEVRPDDVWVVTYPKCGTTWTQEMVWLIMNDLNFEDAKKSLLSRSPFVEFWGVVNPDEEKGLGTEDTIEQADKQPSPRCIKSHLPKDLLPHQLWTKKPKIVYVTRAAKDVLVSYFSHHQLCNGYTGTLDEFVDYFLADNIVYWSPFWKHILDFWKMRNEPNILINSYEEMKKDLPAVIRRTAAFLGKSLSEAQVARLAEHLDFKRMRENPAVNFRPVVDALNERFAITNQFMRRGEAGSGRRELSSQQVERVDRWSSRELAGSDYPFVG